MINRFRTFAVAAAMLLPSAAFAQEMSARPFGQGSRILSIGILTGGDGYEGFGLGGSFEVGVKEFTPTLSLGLGAFAGFVRDDGRAALSEFTVTTVPIMAIGNLHLAMPSQPKLDLYGGLSLGIVSSSVDFEDEFPGSDDVDGDSDVGLGIQFGARYAFTERALGFAQIGLNDIPLLYAGFSFRF